MAHLKRQKAPVRWPVSRKGTTFVVKPAFNPQQGIPLLIILRDMLKICQNRKEAKRAIHEKKILVNGKEATDDKNSLLLFDTLTIIPLKKSYRISFSENGKYKLEDIAEKDSAYKISKIIDKKILKGKRTQINLRDGKNFISDAECKVGDSVKINMKNKGIEKCIPLKEKAKIIVVEGKHKGKIGIIERLEKEKKMLVGNFDNKQINILIKQVMVTE